MSQPNVWSHPHFIRGKLNEVSNIKRVEIKGNGGKKSSSGSSSPPNSPSRRKSSSNSPSRSRKESKEKKEKGSPARNHKRSLSQTNTTTTSDPMVTTDLIRATTDSALSTSNLYQQLMKERIKSKLVSELSAIDNSISSGQLYNHETRLVSEMSSGSYNSGVGMGDNYSIAPSTYSSSTIGGRELPMTNLARGAMSDTFASVPRYSSMPSNKPKDPFMNDSGVRYLASRRIQPTDPFASMGSEQQRYNQLMMSSGTEQQQQYKRRTTIEAAHELLSINNSPVVKGGGGSMIPPVEGLPLAAFNRGVSDGFVLPSPAFNRAATEATRVKDVGRSGGIAVNINTEKRSMALMSGGSMTAANSNVKKLLTDLPMALNRAATEATRVMDDGRRGGMTAEKRSMTPPIDELPMAFIRAAAEAVVKKDTPIVHEEGKKRKPPPQPTAAISAATTTAAQSLTNPPRRSVPFKKRKIIHQYHSEGQEETEQHPAVAAGWTERPSLVNTVTVSSQTPLKNTIEVNQEALLAASQSKRSGGKSSSSSSEGGDSSLDCNVEQQQQQWSSQTPVPEFLTHLHSMLTNPTYNQIISWSVPTQNESIHNGGGILNKGKIIVHNPQSLQDLILGRYYNHSKYSSFQRQLNYFGFKKKLHNGLKGKMSPCSYIHESLTNDVGSLFTLRRRNPSSANKKGGVVVDDSVETPYIEMSVSKDGSLREELKSVNKPPEAASVPPSVQGKPQLPSVSAVPPPLPKQVKDDIGTTNEISRRDAVELATRTTHRVNDSKDLAAAHELLSLFNGNSSSYPPPPPPPQYQVRQQHQQSLYKDPPWSYPPPQQVRQQQQPLYKDQPWPKDDESSSTSSSTTTIKITAEELTMLEKKRPKRPLSAFNLYYRYKRTKIIEAYESSSSSSFTSDSIDTPMCKEKIQALITATPGLESVTNLTDIPPERIPEIARTEIHSALKDNLSPTNARERQHRKTNGVGMTFVEMSKVMSTAWKCIDEVSHRLFEELAEQGRKVHATKVLEYEKLLKEMGIDQKQLTKAKSQQKKKKGGAAKKASQQVQHGGVNCNTEGNVSPGGGHCFKHGGTGERSGCSVEGCTNQAR